MPGWLDCGMVFWTPEGDCQVRASKMFERVSGCGKGATKRKRRYRAVYDSFVPKDRKDGGG
jgi:hypothetical protein